MTAIKLTGFGGEQPKIVPRLLPPTGAQASYNARLDDGGLTPVRQSVLVESLADALQQTIYLHGADWLSWPVPVNAVPGPVATDRLYFTGDGVPKMRVAGVDYALALAPPAGALTATLGGVGAGDVVTRVYVYTWVTSFGEESEPSPASAPIDWQPGNTVVLSGFATTPADRAITTQRIYRSQTGQTGTYLYLIAERAATNADFNDTVAVDAFAEALPSADWNPPPDGLSGLTALPNGMMAGFVDKTLYFCEPFRPHAWPEKYTITTDYPIVALGSVGSSLVVLTTGNPYLVVGQTPGTMQPTRLEQNFPCINARGVADLGFAVCFPTVEGLAAAYGDGRIGLVSTQLFGRPEWNDLGPDTMLGTQYGGRYFAFYDTLDAIGDPLVGSFFVEVGENPFLSRSYLSAQAVFFDITSANLYYVPKGGDGIYLYDAPSSPRADLYWKSKEFWFNAPTNFGAIRVDATEALSVTDQANLLATIAAAVAANEALIAGGALLGELNSDVINALPFGGDNLEFIPALTGQVQVGVWADGVQVASISSVGVAKRLPAGFTAEKWEIDVFATAAVTSIVMAETMDELKMVPG